jgi:hypothetical protein
MEKEKKPKPLNKDLYESIKPKNQNTERTWKSM